MAESFSTHSRRLKKASALSAAHGYSAKYKLPQEQAQVVTQNWSTDAAATLPETHSEIEWIVKKKDAPPPPLPFSIGNERANSLANEGRLQQQPDNPVTPSHVAKILRRKTAALWEAASGSNDERTQKFTEARRADDYIEVLDRCDALQLFRVHAGHSLLRSDMYRRKWSATTACRLCEKQNEDCSHVFSVVGNSMAYGGPTGATLPSRGPYEAVRKIR
ncbi:hypothetical protein PoB_006785800 [Plakobranchus ocellatus]|uniref:Uncharacterized protein n=1 Tax=Plakobranchus ocellatus TaxID=259542 RepID=A0AAV4DAR6_9GAST|nr:hypothetical protein PoB_006785800 [Plakobranchus ocellatus]